MNSFHLRLKKSREDGRAPRDKVAMRGQNCGRACRFALNSAGELQAKRWSTIVWRLRSIRLGRMRLTKEAALRNRRREGWKHVFSLPRRMLWLRLDPKNAAHYEAPAWTCAALYYYRAIQKDIQASRPLFWGGTLGRCRQRLDFAPSCYRKEQVT